MPTRTGTLHRSHPRHSPPAFPSTLCSGAPMNQDTPLVASRPLLVIYTGGTLGMVQGAEGLGPGGAIEARLPRALAALPPPSHAALRECALLSRSSPTDSSAATPRQ